MDIQNIATTEKEGKQQISCDKFTLNIDEEQGIYQLQKIVYDLIKRVEILEKK